MQRLLLQRQSTTLLRSQYASLLRRNASSTANVMSAAKIALNQVPLVDIAPLVHQRRLGGDDSAPANDMATLELKAQILAQMKRACLETGFFTVPTKNVLSNDLITKVQTELNVYVHDCMSWLDWQHTCVAI